MEEQAQSLIDATTAAFKAGKLPGGPGGVAIPPPMPMGMRPPPGMPMGAPGMPPMRPPPGTQSGYFRIFVSLRFYVKSIFEIQEVLKMPFLQFCRLCILIFWLFSAFTKWQKFIKSKCRASKC